MYYNDYYSNIRVVNVSNPNETIHNVDAGRFIPGFPGGTSGFPSGNPSFPGGSVSFPGGTSGFGGGMGSFPGQTGGSSSQSSSQPMQPTSPAPNYIPEKPQKAAQGAGFTSYLVEAPSMVGCRGRWVYIWPTHGGPGYWLFLVYVGNQSIAGFLATGMYFGLDTKYIDAFVCA